MHAIAESIPLFLYGTLRKNESHHELIAPWLVDMVPAKVWGRLYHAPAGYPALELPETSILARGSHSPHDDAATARQLTASCHGATESDWGWVYGDLVTLKKAPKSLPPLDSYEGFQPGRTSLFTRVLAPVLADQSPVSAWVYISAPKPEYTRLTTGTWSPQ